MEEGRGELMADIIKKLFVNGVEMKVDVPAEMRLVDVLRERLRLTGTKEGCGEGECGSCSVLINDEAVNSCLVIAGQLSDGDRIVTVEGLGKAAHLSPLQTCFVEAGGVQCGACTPGMLIAAQALLNKNLNPTREEIARALAGNLCRCTGYAKIIDAVERCAMLLREGSK
jgi:aerobic-type carbon monoxide dehydrogenase small subunit (CoxS/CutS family)